MGQIEELFSQLMDFACSSRVSPAYCSRVQRVAPRRPSKMKMQFVRMNVAKKRGDTNWSWVINAVLGNLFWKAWPPSVSKWKNAFCILSGRKMNLDDDDLVIRVWNWKWGNQGNICKKVHSLYCHSAKHFSSAPRHFLMSTCHPTAKPSLMRNR